MFRLGARHDSDSSDDFESAVEEVTSSSQVEPGTDNNVTEPATDYSRCGIFSFGSNKSIDPGSAIGPTSSATAARPSPPPPQETLQAAERSKSRADGPEQPAPNERFRFKDLDTGKVYILDKKNCIYDRDTGNVYAVNESLLEVIQDDGSKNLSSGRLFSSYEEFEQQLGLAKTEADRHRRTSSNETNEVGSESDSRPERLSKRVKNKLKQQASMASKLFNPRSPLSPASPTNSTASQNDILSALTNQSLTEAGVQEESGSGASGAGVPVKVTTNKKMVKELSQLHLVQELKAHSGVIWTMKFSRNGRYLATSGQDCQVVVWEVVRNAKAASGDAEKGSSNMSIPSEPDEEAADGEPSSTSNALGRDSGDAPTSTSATCSVYECDHPVLNSIPFRTYMGHKADILDLCWSKKEQFLLSASMDHTVRLWHISMEQCLRVFKHSDFVTSIDFHPVDDRYFISGSIDGKVCMWNIPDHDNTDWTDVHDMVTATCFSKDGRRAVVGTMKGKCRFYTCESTFKLEYEAQIDVKNKRGKQTRGKKITGLQFLPGESNKLLITSNDSRLRLYEGYILQCKFKGLHNRNTQIKATFSNDGQYVLCGSDNGAVYLWSTCNAASSSCAKNEGGKEAAAPQQDKVSSYECFQAFDDIVTVAIFAPGTARRQLAVPQETANGKDSGRVASKWRALGSPESAESIAAAECVMATARNNGTVILAAGYSGEIKIFENCGRPHWV